MELSAVNERLLVEVDLVPIQGDRFQPTGFPDLGAAEITLPNNDTVLLVESAQSMANRLEDVCLNEEKTDYVNSLEGLSMVVVTQNNTQLTNSVREAHRIGSYYILRGESTIMKEKLENMTNMKGWEPKVLSKTAPTIFEIDVGSLLHGVWIADKIADGRIKIPRALSSFIEAKHARIAVSGGVKFDHVDPASSGSEKAGAAEGQGHVPFSRTEYTAQSITAYFNLDLQQIHSYGLRDEQTKLLINLALWKIRRLLSKGLRLRTACDLRVKSIRVIEPSDYVFPSMEEIDSRMRESINACKDFFSDHITIEYTKKKK